MTGTKRCLCPDHDDPNPLPADGFRKNSRARDGLATWCKKCTDRQYAEWKRQNPESSRAASRKWNQAHRETMRETERRYLARLRDQVLSHYGPACACCGTDGELCLDHVYGGGKSHRVAMFGRNAVQKRMYRWLIDNDFPAGFQILCRPCNASKSDGPACRLDHA